MLAHQMGHIRHRDPMREVLEVIGRGPVLPRRLERARYDGPWGRAMARRRFRPVTLATDAQGGLVATALPWRGSGDLFVLAAAEGLAVLPEHAEGPDPEGRVEVLLLDLPGSRGSAS